MIRLRSITLVLTAALTLAACAPADDAAPAAEAPVRLAEGTWTGGLTPMNHPEMITPLTYDVAYEDGALSLVLGGPGGAPMPARDAELREDTLYFMFDEPDAGVPLTCALGREDAGSFVGRCTDADGKWARFTMVPPGE